MSAPRRRLDAELVRRGLCPSRETARASVLAGQVLVAGAPALKPGRLVSPAEPVVVQGPRPRYVSRGGRKLEAALATFDIDPMGRRAIDVGASTGGFTDCLLQHGAAQVVAIDVGYGQLHERLRADPRVQAYERVNVRHLDAASIGGPAPLVVVDLSFISLRTVLAALEGLVTPEGQIVALVKPQFEAGRQQASRGRGVISDPGVWRRVLEALDEAVRARDGTVQALAVSPVTGTDGNVEFFALLAPPGSPPRALAADALDGILAQATRVAGVAR